jgi:hypothetical protein
MKMAVGKWQMARAGSGIKRSHLPLCKLARLDDAAPLIRDRMHNIGLGWASAFLGMAARLKASVSPSELILLKRFPT